jgi:signal transduction histidine kinase/CheY-like chemotaxis protein
MTVRWPDRERSFLPDTSNRWRLRGPVGLIAGSVAAIGCCTYAAIIGLGDPTRAFDLSGPGPALALATGAAIVVMLLAMVERGFAMRELRQLGAVVENLPEAVVAIDAEHRITLANPAAVWVLRLLADVGPGEVLTQLVGRDIRSYLDAPDMGSTHELVLDGEPRRVFEMAVATSPRRRSTVSHVLVLREVTTEFETRRLLQQQDRLASVGQLAAGIAHDFNNMLQAITGFAELIRTEDGAPDKVVERAAGISRQGRRGARLIRQILDFSRTSISALKPLDLEELLRETLRMLQRMLPETVRVVTEIEARRFQVAGDAGQLQQVITNVVVNARDAMADDEGELRVALHSIIFGDDDPRPFPQMQAGEWLGLSFTDTGAGIPEEYLSRIYDPFFTTKDIGEGTGLGLAQVYGIVKQHRGFVDVASELGSGTTITIYLPPDASEIVQAAEGRQTQLGHGQLILLVEDEEPVLQAVRDTLERLDYAVIPASGGVEALNLYEQCETEIDLVITDVVMPGVGGLDLVRSLRRLDPSIPVVLMSGYPLRDRAHDLVNEDQVAWISKPFTMHDIGEVISGLLYPDLGTRRNRRRRLPTSTFPTE